MTARVEIYTTEFCGYCTRAKALLASKGVTFEEYKAGGNAEKKREMIQRSGGYTFPQVFINGRSMATGFPTCTYCDSPDLLFAVFLDSRIASCSFPLWICWARAVHLAFGFAFLFSPWLLLWQATTVTSWESSYSDSECSGRPLTIPF